MIEKISDKILDILQADARLYAGGNAYGPGWTGVKRPDVSGTAAEGYVNLFDKPHDEDAGAKRPAVYVGSKGIEASDVEEYEVQSKDGHIEARLLTIPLVICVQAQNKFDARKRRNQLRQNIKSILAGFRLVDGFWYWLEMKGAAGGPMMDRVSTSSSGSGDQQVSEGVGVVPLSIHYTWSANCDP